jgi:pilus assembly protein Flp/PilA
LFLSDFDPAFRKGAKIMMFSLKERGQGMVEYALILVLVAIVVIAALTLMGPLVRNIFSTINASL